MSLTLRRPRSSYLFVYMDPKLRMPVGFVERVVTGTDAAKAVGATQRELPESV